VLDGGPHTDLPDLSVPEAIDRVIVYHAHRLHEGVADRRSDEFEASTQQIAAEGVRLRRARGHLAERAPEVHPGCSANKAPHVDIETPEFPLNREESFCVVYRAADLEAVANDARVPEQAIDSCWGEACYSHRIETDKCVSIGFPLLEDRLPAQASLGAFKRKKLEEDMVVVNRYAPLDIVISDTQWSSSPATTGVLIHGFALSGC